MIRFWLSPFISPPIFAAMFAGAPPPPVVVSSPSFTGSLVEGQTLTLVQGEITGATARLFTIERDGQLIEGEAGPTYQVRPADIGAQIVVREYASNAGGTVSAASAASAVVTAAANEVTFASFEGVTFNGGTTPTTAGAYTPDIIGGGTGQTSVFSGTNGRIANGRFWANAGCIYAYGPQRADQSVSARFTRRSAVTNNVVGLTLRNGGAASYNGYHVYWVEASSVWRFTNGNTTSLGGSFTDIADSWAFGTDRVVHFSAIGTAIAYTIIDAATGAVVGTRTGVNATYASGWGGFRQQSNTASTETTGITMDWIATYTAAQTNQVVLVDGPATVNEDTASSVFTAMLFGSSPPQLSCFGAASGTALVTPATALNFAAVHANHPSCRSASFTVTPQVEGDHVVQLNSVHVNPRMPRTLFSISATPPTIRPAFSVRRGANTPVNAGDVNLNALLLTAGYVDQWNVAFVSGTGGGVAADWSGVGNGQRRFPTPAPGATLTGKGYVFSFTSADNPAITTNITISCPANVVTISKPADVVSAMGAASSTNIANAGRTFEIARAASGFAAAKLYLERHNSQATSTTPLVIKYEDAAFPAILAGFHQFNCNYVTAEGLQTSLTRAQGSQLATTHFYATGSTFYSVNDKCGIGLVLDGCRAIGMAGAVTQTCDAIVLNLSTGATPVVRNCILRWVQNGVKTAGTLATQTLENNDIRYFTSNGMIITGSTGLTRIDGNGFRSPMRDTSNDPASPDHLDAIQFGDGTVFATLEMERNIYAAADGNAGCQGFFGGTTINAGYMARNIVINPSAAHALRPATIAGTFSMHANTVIHQRRRYQANPLVYVDDTLTDGTVIGQTPGISVVSAQASNVVRRCWSQNQVSVSAATIGFGVLTYRNGQTQNVIAANDPAVCFSGWAEMANYDWTVDSDLATFKSEVLRLLKPVPTAAIHLSDGTYGGAVANDGGTAKFNDEAVYA